MNSLLSQMEFSEPDPLLDGKTSDSFHININYNVDRMLKDEM